MQWWQAIILGIVQGATEFLPISSSGHLVLVQNLMGLELGTVFFEVVVHVATLFAVIVFFWKRILAISFREWIVIGIATIPAVFMGLAMQFFFHDIFSSLSIVAVMLFITGLINYYADSILEQRGAGFEQPESHSDSDVPELITAFKIGLAQALAIIPGISRSGSTVAAALSLGVDRSTAFTFSFLLAIPAISGAFILQLFTLIQEGSVASTLTFASLPPLLLGALASFVVGWCSLYFLEKIMIAARLEIFAWYCWVVAALTLVASMF